jgi:hypothetical protein
LVSNLSQRKPIHFLKVKLIGSASNRDGQGATVKVKAGEATLTQFNDGKSGYLLQSAIPLFFGLGDVVAASSVEIRWPSGKTQFISDGIPRNGVLIVGKPKE